MKVSETIYVERIATSGGISTVLVGGILHPNKKRK
jgi:hypothetical protein